MIKCAPNFWPFFFGKGVCGLFGGWGVVVVVCCCGKLGELYCFLKMLVYFLKMLL